MGFATGLSAGSQLKQVKLNESTQAAQQRQFAVEQFSTDMTNAQKQVSEQIAELNKQASVAREVGNQKRADDLAAASQKLSQTVSQSFNDRRAATIKAGIDPSLLPSESSISSTFSTVSPDPIVDAEIKGIEAGKTEKAKVAAQVEGKPSAGADRFVNSAGKAIEFRDSGEAVFSGTNEVVPQDQLRGLKKIPTQSIQGTKDEVLGTTPKTKGAIEGDILKSQKGIGRLNQVRNKFRTDFLTIGGKLKAAGLAMADKVGVKISGENSEFLTDFTDFTVSAIRNINDYIKEVTGAQMSEFEAKRLRRGMPDPGDGVFGGQSPKQFQAALDNVMNDMQLVLARANIMREQGIEYDFEANPDSDGPVTLGQTREIINQRGKEIMAGLLAQDPNLSQQEAQRRAQRMVQQQFGMIE